MKIRGMKFTIKVLTQYQTKGAWGSQTSIILTGMPSPPKPTPVEEEEQEK